MADSRMVELLVGRVGRAHGLKGDVAVDVRTDEPDRRFAAGTTYDTARGRLTVASTAWHGQRLVVSFHEASDRAAADGLRGVELRVAVPSDVRPDDPDEFYDHQLVGLTACSESGEVVGPVTDVLHLPAQDVLVIRRGSRDVLVPFVCELVPAVDLTSGQVVVADQPGLLEDEPAEGEA